MIGEIVPRFLPHADFEAVVEDLPNDLVFRCGFHSDRDEHPVSILQVIAHVGEVEVLLWAGMVAINCA